MTIKFVLSIVFVFFFANNLISQTNKLGKYIKLTQAEVGRRLGEESEIKGKHIWTNEFKGKMVRWTGSILTIEDKKDEFMSKSDNFELTFEDVYFSLSGEVIVSVIFSRKWQAKLLDLQIGSHITIEGKLNGYSVWSPGIAPSVFLTVSNAKIVE